MNPIPRNTRASRDGRAHRELLAAGCIQEGKAVLTLQSALLQALVAHGAMSPGQALEVVDVAVEVSKRIRALKVEEEVALVTVEALEGVRVGLADLVKLSSVSP